jgi:phosphohistidine phosphatase
MPSGIQLEVIVNLFLVQHGQAKTEAEDPAQSLNVVGVDSAEKVARHLYLSGVGVTEIRHSGKRRAEQTASIFAKHLSPRHGVAAASGLNPMDDVRRVAGELGQHPGALMLVGHLPFMSRLAGLLVAGDPEREVVRFQNAGVVCLSGHESRWSVEWIIVPGLVKD